MLNISSLNENCILLHFCRETYKLINLNISLLLWPSELGPVHLDGLLEVKVHLNWGNPIPKIVVANKPYYTIHLPPLSK